MNINPCATCYTQEYPECTENITIAGGFTAAATYLVVVKDQFGNSYRTSVTANNNGELLIPAADFPPGLFSRFAGIFEFIFYTLDGCTAFEPALCGTVYPCVLVTFVQTSDSSSADATDVIGCCETVEASLELTQANFTCNGNTPTIGLSMSVAGTSGEYRVQVLVNDVWAMTNQFEDAGTGTISYSGNLELSPAPGTYQLRVIDRQHQTVISNALPVNITDCESAIVFSSVDFLCQEGHQFAASNFNVTNASGHYSLQMEITENMWAIVAQFDDSTDGAVSSVNELLLPQSPGNFQVRIYDGVDYSNELTLVVTQTCDEQITLQSIGNFNCDPISGVLNADITISIDGYYGNLSLQYFNGTTWVNVASLDNGTVNRSLPAYLYGLASDFRAYDTTNNLASGIILYSIPDCQAE